MDAIDFLDQLSKRLESAANEMALYSMTAQERSLRRDSDGCRKMADELRAKCKSEAT